MNFIYNYSFKNRSQCQNNKKLLFTTKPATRTLNQTPKKKKLNKQI